MKEYDLDVLGTGSVLGAYSVINESHYEFSGKAKTNLTILVLHRDDLLQAAEDFVDLTEAIEGATLYIIENEVPLCDYTKGVPEVTIEKQKRLDMTFRKDGGIMKELFRNAVRKVQVLNKRKDLRLVRLYEQIKHVS